jgi:hypothetical protein
MEDSVSDVRDKESRDIDEQQFAGSSDRSHPCHILREEHAEVVRPVVERAIQLSARQNRRILAMALSPVVWSAMWRAFTGIFKNAIVGINRFFVLNFSGEGIRWRMEAFRTGKSFRQVVLEHSLMCPVSQVFLIHRRTGLLIKQSQQAVSGVHDGDMVSGMLTAIQDFVHDSFISKDSGQLEVIRVGNVTVLLEQAPLAILAGIITQGVAPQQLRQTFRRALDQISDDYHRQLVDFRGDIGLFDGVEPVLESCLKTRLVVGEDRISPLTGLAVLAPLVVAAVYGFLGWQQHAHWKHYLQKISDTSGIVVVETGWRGGQRFVRGLYDPMGTNPESILLNSGIDPNDIKSEWHYFHSLCPELVKERVRRVLKPPPTVSISYHDGIVALSGSAPWNWVEHAPARIAGVAGVVTVQTDGVRQTGVDQKLAWNRYLARIAELPGILVLKQGRGRNKFYISGMRDALAPDPIQVLVDSGLDTNSVASHWEPFQGLHPSLIMARSRRMLEPPPSVELQLDGNVLRLKGRAPHAWIAQARLISRGIAGVSSLNISQLQDTDLHKLDVLSGTFDNYIFYYLDNRRDLWPGQENTYLKFIELIGEFAGIVQTVGGGYKIEIRGHVPDSGDAEKDLADSKSIAELFYNRLRGRHVPMHLFVRRGLGSVPAPAAAQSERKHEPYVSFDVIKP